MIFFLIEKTEKTANRFHNPTTGNALTTAYNSGMMNKRRGESAPQFDGRFAVLDGAVAAPCTPNPL